MATIENKYLINVWKFSQTCCKNGVSGNVDVHEDVHDFSEQLYNQSTSVVFEIPNDFETLEY